MGSFLLMEMIYSRYFIFIYPPKFHLSIVQVFFPNFASNPPRIEGNFINSSHLDHQFDSYLVQ